MKGRVSTSFLWRNCEISQSDKHKKFHCITRASDVSNILLLFMCGYVSLTTWTKYFPITISLKDGLRGAPTATGHSRDFTRLYISPVGGKSIFYSDFKQRISFPVRQCLIFHSQCSDTQNTASLKTAHKPRDSTNPHHGWP